MTKLSPYDPSRMDFLADQDPRMREAVRLYCDPLSGTYGNKTASALRAGYSSATDASHVFKHPAVIAEINRIAETRSLDMADVYEYVLSYSIDAARELVDQLQQGRELEYIDPTKAIENAHNRDAAAEAKEINAHNRNVIALMRERRDAAARILSYQIGTPERPIDPQGRDRRKGPLDGILDLSKLSKEDLQVLQRTIEEISRAKTLVGHGTEAIEGEFTVVEDDDE